MPASSSTPLSAEEFSQQRDALRKRFWRSNLRLVSCLMACWAFLSFGCGILFSEFLDRWMLPGTSMPLGFFMAQQGAIYGFLLLIVVYVGSMGRLEKRFRRELKSLEARRSEAGDEKKADSSAPTATTPEH